MTGAFENFERAETVNRSSNRTFGLVFAAFFALIAFGPLLRSHAVRWWAADLALLFLATAFVAPCVLAPLNRGWTALGAMLHRITNPIVLGAFFYVGFAPFGWVLRRMGYDFLRLKRDPEASSYWLPRQPPGPAPESMTNQY
jgi:Saxitoxin biosynthesis operon protein SxtJ